jgi:hypothetical protein
MSFKSYGHLIAYAIGFYVNAVAIMARDVSHKRHRFLIV